LKSNLATREATDLSQFCSLLPGSYCFRLWF